MLDLRAVRQRLLLEEREVFLSAVVGGRRAGERQPRVYRRGALVRDEEVDRDAGREVEQVQRHEAVVDGVRLAELPAGKAADHPVGVGLEDVGEVAVGDGLDSLLGLGFSRHLRTPPRSAVVVPTVAQACGGSHPPYASSESKPNGGGRTL